MSHFLLNILYFAYHNLHLIVDSGEKLNKILVEHFHWNFACSQKVLVFNKRDQHQSCLNANCNIIIIFWKEYDDGMTFWKFTNIKINNWISPHFFQKFIFPWKKGSECPKFRDFSKFIINFQKIQKNFFLVFHSVLGWYRRCRLIQPPRTLATSRSPTLLGLNLW